MKNMQIFYGQLIGIATGMNFIPYMQHIQCLNIEEISRGQKDAVFLVVHEFDLSFKICEKSFGS